MVYKCELCEFETKTSWNIKLHNLYQHPTKEEKSKSKYYCEICDRILFLKSHFKGIKHKNLVLLNKYNKNLNYL